MLNLHVEALSHSDMGGPCGKEHQISAFLAFCCGFRYPPNRPINYLILRLPSFIAAYSVGQRAALRIVRRLGSRYSVATMRFQV